MPGKTKFDQFTIPEQIYGATLLADTVAAETKQPATLCVRLDFDTDEPERLAALVGSVKGDHDWK